MAVNPPEATGKTGEVNAGGYSLRQNLLYFDKEANTLYYEFNITSDTPMSDPLELGSFLVYFDIREYENEPVSAALSKMKEVEPVHISEDQVWGGIGVPDDLGRRIAVLAPGNYATMPHGEKDQWISNIGIIDGKLHVQSGKVWYKEFGSGGATFSLMAPDGKLIESDYELMLYGDRDGHLLDFEKDDYDDAAYKYEESVFSVNAEDLDGYTLCYTGAVYSGVEGDWKVVANLSDTSRQMRIWTSDIEVDGYCFEYLTLSPLGLEVRGSYEGDKWASEMSLALETGGGMIQLEGGGGGQDVDEHTFNANWHTEEPIDVATVTAVVVNDTRIPVK